MKIANIGGARAAIHKFKDEDRYLLFNGEAMFTLQDEIGKDFSNMIGTQSREAYEALAKTAYVLSEQGELARRKIGLDPKEILKPEEWQIDELTPPIEMMQLRNACIDAISHGYARELTNEDEEIDLGLIELQKKSEPQGRNI